jgi:hypothetical protein
VARLWAVAVTLPKVKPKASLSERCPPIRYKGVVSREAEDQSMTKNRYPCTVALATVVQFVILFGLRVTAHAQTASPATGIDIISTKDFLFVARD